MMYNHHELLTLLLNAFVMRKSIKFMDKFVLQIYLQIIFILDFLPEFMF